MREVVENYFNNEFKRPITINELSAVLNYTSDEDYLELGKILNDLEDEFIITHNKKYEFAPLSFFNLYVGTLDDKQNGFGFVDTLNFGIYVDEKDFKGAYNSDLVIVKYFQDPKKKPYGVIQRIIKRGFDTVTGKIIFRNGHYFVVSIDNKVRNLVEVLNDDLNGSQAYDMVTVKIVSYNPLRGIVTKVIGHSFEKGIDISSIVESSGVNVDFSADSLKEAASLPHEINVSDYSNRVNLIDKQIITIDGIDAKDLDDAVRVEQLEDGNYLLGVYIADVSNYVKENSSLDLDAMERGTSIYLPDRVIPMLPVELSNGICSLNEGCPRLVMGIEAIINPQGLTIDSKIFEAVIKTTHRMNYDDVNAIINGDELLIDKYQDIFPLIKSAENLAKILKDYRTARGSFFFESTDSKLELNNLGKVSHIDLEIRGLAEEIIEEFMLRANEVVAETMTYLDVPFIYRVHENPKREKIDYLINFLKDWGMNYKINNDKSIPKVLQKILNDNSLNEPNLTKLEQAKRQIINHEMVRSMAKAKYQDFNIGHFGLASKCYTHFTSPIRRYPDLMVHRLIKEFLLNDPQVKEDNLNYFTNKVSTASIKASQKEKTAEKLERDCEKYKICEYYEDHLGTVEIGIISEITKYGYFINLANGVSGFAEISDSGYGHYLGEEVEVKVIDASRQARTIDLKILRKENGYVRRKNQNHQ